MSQAEKEKFEFGYIQHMMIVFKFDSISGIECLLELNLPLNRQQESTTLSDNELMGFKAVSASH